MRSSSSFRWTSVILQCPGGNRAGGRVAAASCGGLSSGKWGQRPSAGPEFSWRFPGDSLWPGPGPPNLAHRGPAQDARKPPARLSPPCVRATPAGSGTSGAEAARNIAVEEATKRNDPSVIDTVGALDTELAATRIALASMVAF